jgi:hypothetical protein
MTALACPMHPKPHPACSADGECPAYGRSWSVDADGNMMSKRRAVKIVGPLEPGADINAVIKPVS